MRSNIKLLIAAVVILLFLGGAIAALVLTGNSEETETEETTVTTQTESPSRLLYDKDPVQIENIHIKNEKDEYDIKQYADETWSVPDFVGLPHSTVNLNDILDNAATVTSQQVASEEPSDLSVYGLESPQAEVTVTFKGGDKKVLHIGDPSPSAGLTYVSFDDDKTVHAVNTSDVDCFLEDRFYYLAKTVYTPKQPADENDTTDYTKINSITISRKDLDYDIVLEYDVRQDMDEIITGNSASHIMSSPVRLDLNPDLAYETLSGVFGLTADEVAATAPDEAMMARFGLDDPFAEVNFDIAGENFRLLIGNSYTDEEGGKSGYFGYAEGIDIIYAFERTSLPWAEIKPMDITMTMITSTYIYAIDTLEVTTAEGSTLFKLSGDQDNFAVDCGDPDVTVDNFKSFYQYFLRAPAEELYLEETDAPADVTVTVKTELGTDVVEFVRSEDRMSVIRLNGVTSFRCRTAYADRLIENLGHLLNGEDIITTW